MDYEELQKSVNHEEVIRIREKFLNSQDRKFLIVCVSRFTQGKGQEVLVQAIRSLSKVELVGKIKVLFLGAGNSSSLENLIQTREDKENFSVLGFKNNIVDYISAADLVAHPSTIDSFSQLILEAQALGKPVVDVDAGAAKSQIQDGKTGFVVHKGDASEIADRIAYLLMDEDQLKEFGARAELRIMERYPAQKMLFLIDEICGVTASGS